MEESHAHPREGRSFELGGTVRWVILTDDYPRRVGGVATWSGWAADALRTTGEVRVYARDRPTLDGAVGVRGRHFARYGGRYLAQASFSELRQADAVLCTTWPVASWAVHVARRSTPVHVVFHGSDVPQGRAPRAFFRVMRRARAWAVSEHLVQEARRLRVAAQHLPVPVPAMDAVPGGGRWVMVARAVPGKGGERFVRLCAAAGRPGDVVGDGPELGRWRALAERLGAEVRFHGSLDRADLERVYAEAGLVFLLSHARADGGGEGLGLALVEAAARGIATVGAPTGGIPEVAGLVLERPDDVGHSLARIERWWNPARGEEAQAAIREAHGVQPFLRAIRS